MSKYVSRFWWRWLMLMVGGVLLFSLSLILVPDTMQDFFNGLFFSSSGAQATFSAQAFHYINFVYGLLGAVMLGWMVMIWRVVMGPFRRGEREAWNTLALSIMIWFVVDSSFSLVMGFPANAVFNTLIFLLFAAPLAATYKNFHSA